MATVTNALNVYLAGRTDSVATSGLRVVQAVDADGFGVHDFRIDGRSLGWDYDPTTDTVTFEAETGDSVPLTRVGDYFRWTVTPDDLGGPGAAPGSTLAVTGNFVVERNTGGVKTRLTSLPVDVTLERRPGFNPNRISGLVLQLDAYAVTEAVAATVQTWDDKTLYDRDAAQSTSGSRPTRQNDGTGRPYLLFDGTDDQMATAWDQFGDPCTLFVCGRITTADATVRGIAQVGGTNGARLAFNSSNLKGVSGTDTANTTLPALNTPFVGVVTKAAAGNVTVQLGTAASVSQASTAAVTDGTMQLADTAADSPASCGIYEVLVFDYVLSAGNIETVVRYLQKKWGAS